MTPPPLFGSALFGASPASAPAPLAGCDAANALADVWYRLGFSSAEDAADDDRWVTSAELLQFADDAVKALARTTSLFFTYDASVPIAAGVAACALPASQVFAEGAWLRNAGGSVTLLRSTSVGQLFALDARWSAAVGAPTRVSYDALGVDTAVLYPSPVANATLAQVVVALPATLAAGASAVPCSVALQSYLSDAMIAGARSKESDSRMDDLAAHLRERMKLMEALIGHLWGDR